MAGRYGPYVKWGKVFATLPKGTEPEAVTFEMAVALANEKAAKGGKARKPAAKKATARKAAGDGAATGTAAPKGAAAKARTVAAKKRA